MRFALTAYGSRGDVEPTVVVGRELVSRGHDVQMALPPNLVDFAEAAGVRAVAYGLDSWRLLEIQRRYWTCFFSTPWKLRDLERLGREMGEFITACWSESTTLTSLADGTDLVIAGVGFEQFAANVAEYYDLPFATLHYFPMRANGEVLGFLPAPLGRSVMTLYEKFSWNGPIKDVEDKQRRELGLSKATSPWPQRITDRGSLEIQAYDEAVFPGLAMEWAKFNGQRPFVGMLTLALPTSSDEEVVSWITSGTAPIFFGFGSISIESAAETLALVAAACERLGERALVCAGGTDCSRLPHFDHVKVVDTVNYATVFPLCRAVVHHGGAGTTAAGLRAGVPALILWTFPDQPVSGAALKRLRVGLSRRLSTTTTKSLVADLRRILSHEYLAGARQLAAQMTTPARSASATADLVENFARFRQVV